MPSGPAKLRDQLKSVLQFLGDPAITLSEVEMAQLERDASGLVRKLDELSETYLTIGLLGGTGVGKSSLMNALAQSPIASTSHRRPHTERILIYRHETAPLPPELTNEPLAWEEITHGAEEVRQVVICDLPDFDSLLKQHRQRVIGFMEHLDILVWVTTPEKYADQQFYCFLKDVPKSRNNFYFVLNKADVLFLDGRREQGYERLLTLTELFQDHLRRHEVSEPIVYALSAREFSETGHCSPWNQFRHFRNEIFRLRDAKEVVQIKASNVEAEVAGLLRVLENERMALRAVHDILGGFVEELAEQRSAWRESGAGNIREILGRVEETAFFPQASGTMPLIGMGRVIAAMVREWGKVTREESSSEDLVERICAGLSSTALKREFERIENRLVGKLLQRGMSPGVAVPLKGVLDAEMQWQSLVQRMRDTLRTALADHRFPAFVALKVAQRLTYTGLLFLFLFSLWRSGTGPVYTEHPTWMDWGGRALGALAALFQPTGFAALGSWLLLSAIAGWKFYGLYKKILQGHRQKFIETLQLRMEAVWDQGLDALISALNEGMTNFAGRISALPFQENAK